MNRRQKIIVSVTGIFIVLLLLVGLTYGYFLTKINGNTNTKSISVSTANLALVYGDDDGNVIGDGETIIPNTTFEPKTFTVTNEGNATTDYVVVIENATSTFTNNDFVYTLTCTSDGEPCTGVDTETTYPINGGTLVANTIEVGKTHTYSFTLKYVDTGSDQSEDMGKTLTGRINIKDSDSSNPYAGNKETLAYNIINNSIVGTNGTTLKSVPDTTPAEEISWTKATGKYEEQELDMSTQSEWLYGDTYDDAQPWNGGSTSGYVHECNDTIVGKYISYPTVSKSWYVKSCKSSTVAIVETEIFDYEQELSVTQDDYGTSYYYRGNVEDNYVEFNNMCWRIVRIEGDGSIKITLAAQKKCSEITDSDTGTAYIGTGNYGYTKTSVTNSSGATSSSEKYVADYLNGQTDKENSMKTQLDTWLTSSGIDTTKLKQDNWCLGNWTDPYNSSGVLQTSTTADLMYNETSFYYDTYRRLYGKGTTANATLKCSGENYETYSSYIGALTADEVVFAGGKAAASNANYYLTNNATSNYWWTLSPSSFDNDYDRPFRVNYGGRLDDYFVSYPDDHGFRPAVSLASNAKITSGDGTQNNPYIVE